MSILEDYQDFVKKGSYTKLPYIFASLGIAGEAGEVLEEASRKHIDVHKFVLELGDELWYTTVLAQELGSNLDALNEASVSEHEVQIHPLQAAIWVSIKASRVSDELKKAIRDNESQLDGGRKERLLEMLAGLFESLKVASLSVNVTISDVMEANMEKLLERYPSRYGGVRNEGGE